MNDRKIKTALGTTSQPRDEEDIWDKPLRSVSGGDARTTTRPKFGRSTKSNEDRRFEGTQNHGNVTAKRKNQRDRNQKRVPTNSYESRATPIVKVSTDEDFIVIKDEEVKAPPSLLNEAFKYDIYAVGSHIVTMKIWKNRRQAHKIKIVVAALAAFAAVSTSMWVFGPFGKLTSIISTLTSCGLYLYKQLQTKFSRLTLEVGEDTPLVYKTNPRTIGSHAVGFSEPHLADDPYHVAALVPYNQHDNSLTDNRESRHNKDSKTDVSITKMTLTKKEFNSTGYVDEITFHYISNKVMDDLKSKIHYQLSQSELDARVLSYTTNNYNLNSLVFHANTNEIDDTLLYAHFRWTHLKNRPSVFPHAPLPDITHLDIESVKLTYQNLILSNPMPLASILIQAGTFIGALSDLRLTGQSYLVQSSGACQSLILGTLGRCLPAVVKDSLELLRNWLAISLNTCVGSLGIGTGRMSNLFLMTGSLTSILGLMLDPTLKQERRNLTAFTKKLWKGKIRPRCLVTPAPTQTVLSSALLKMSIMMEILSMLAVLTPVWTSLKFSSVLFAVLSSVAYSN